MKKKGARRRTREKPTTGFEKKKQTYIFPEKGRPQERREGKGLTTEIKGGLRRNVLRGD